MISGFTIVRNAIKLDYPFKESLLSLLPLCDEIVINCGDSDDGTVEFCEQFASQFSGRIKLIRSTWAEKNQKGGYQLKAQTDTALAACRGEWCFYLQADEVLHQADHEAIRRAIALADKRPDIDGVVFQYLHFYGSYDYQIRGRNWYRREVRLFKNHRGIQAFRDAQGFRIGERRLSAFSSGARVFHYGYVRSVKSLDAKAREMNKWWGVTTRSSETTQSQLKNHVGLSRFTDSHPGVMTDRIKALGQSFQPERCPRVWDLPELKNALTLLWDKVFPFRIGEFRNFDLKSL